MLLVKDQDETNILNLKFTFAGGVIVSLLIFALVALAERILYDLARAFAPGRIDYFDNLDVILVHAVFIIVVLIVSIMINFLFALKQNKYAIVLIPYYALSIILALQLIIQVAVYFSSHHTKIQFYIVMLLLVLITSYAIYFIQNRYKSLQS
ncbi:MAG: hypothetical protein Q8P83_03870 [bacterium]|nr:hypothetical protein [bacterium]